MLIEAAPFIRTVGRQVTQWQRDQELERDTVLVKLPEREVEAEEQTSNFRRQYQ